MNMSQSNKCYLDFMKDIYEVSNELSIRTYIWGGFTSDIFEGEFLREHGDVDGFVENMMSILDQLIIKYKNRGYHTEFRNDINMLVVKKGNQHAAFNSLDIDGTVAMWRHIGDQGTVYFPFSWLDDIPHNFYDTKVYTSGLCFEYGFRKIVGNLNPEWKEREKDRIAKEYLEMKIKEKGLDTKMILKSIWSYSPFWIKKGYDPFDKPTLVWPNLTE
jgi:hypothetical protein